MFSSFSRFLKQQFAQLIPKGLIVNWSDFDKGLLILILSGLNQFAWLIWCIYSYITPEFRVWINPEYMFQRIIEISVTMGLTFILFIALYKFRHVKWVYHSTSRVVATQFSILYLHAAYSIGVSSPTTSAGFISIVTLAFLLVERQIIYMVIIPSSMVLLVLIYLSATANFPYAPVFSEALNSSDVYKNNYWIGSMLFLYLPILIVSMGLVEILLRQWRNRELQIKKISEKDGLTNIYNRRSISEKLLTLDRKDLIYAIILLDIDYFKNINDNYGHDIGDEVLKQIASLLEQNIRPEDMVGRFGGEEFIIILNEINLSTVVEIAERCRLQIENMQIQISPTSSIHLTASFGIAIRKQSETNENIIRLADQALYLAKTKGRNQIEHYLNVLYEPFKNTIDVQNKEGSRTENRHQ